MKRGSPGHGGDGRRAGSVKAGRHRVNSRTWHFCWRRRASPLPFLPVPEPSDRSLPRRLLSEVNNPRLSLFDEVGTQERESAVSGRIAEYAIITLVVLVIAGLELARWFFDAKPQPLLFGFVAVGITAYSAVRIGLLWRQLRSVRRGQQAQYSLRAAVDDICARGWLLFDGLTDGRGHLLGSVLAGPGGLFTLIPRFLAHGGNPSEKVSRRDADTLCIGSQTVLADPIGQARRAAHSLYDVLAAEGLDTISVQPAVVFPGWNVEQPKDGDEEDVWLLSDADIVPRLTQAPTVLEARDLIAVSLLLERLSHS